MSALFLATFLAGLLLGVRVMLYGVERDAQAPFALDPARIGREYHPPTPRVRMWLPLVAAFLTGFGVAGYLTLRGTGRTGMAIGVGVLVGAILAALASRVVRRAVRFIPEHDPDDPRYVLQGHVATVTAPISTDADGEVAYAVEGANHVARARAIDGSHVGVGDEVVIERIEDGVAYVEPWVAVERRLEEQV